MDAADMNNLLSAIKENTVKVEAAGRDQAAATLTSAFWAARGPSLSITQKELVATWHTIRGMMFDRA